MKKSHKRLWCPATAERPLTRQCANTRGECGVAFTVKPSNPQQVFCSKKCWNKMRDHARKKRDRVNAGTSKTEEEREEAHMAPFAKKSALVSERAAEVAILTGEASYRLWAKLLGLKEGA
jgi:hypothetical protein